MESTTNWEYNTLINELTHGREQAMQLRLHLNSTPSPQPQDLLQKILASYERSLLILNWNGPLVQPPQLPVLPITALESSLSVDGSPCSDEMSKNVPANECHSSISRKRKAMPTWTKLVRINPQTGLEGPGDDGYSWRKYGQKNILGTNYPRSYYRCTYRHTHDCWATKQVQRSDEDPSVFELTYKGNHACIPASGSAPPPTTSPKHNYHYHNNNESLQPDQMLMHLKANLRVKTDDSETIKHEKSPVSALPTFSSMAGKNPECSLPILAPNVHHFPRTYTPPFISPATSESNYFSASSSQMNEFGHFQESEQNGMFSGNASSTNSPIAGLEFLMDPVASDSKYPFDTTGFFS